MPRTLRVNPAVTPAYWHSAASWLDDATGVAPESLPASGDTVCMYDGVTPIDVYVDSSVALPGGLLYESEEAIAYSGRLIVRSSVRAAVFGTVSSPWIWDWDGDDVSGPAIMVSGNARCTVYGDIGNLWASENTTIIHYPEGTQHSAKFDGACNLTVRGDFTYDTVSSDYIYGWDSLGVCEFTGDITTDGSPLLHAGAGVCRFNQLQIDGSSPAICVAGTVEISTCSCVDEVLPFAMNGGTLRITNTLEAAGIIEIDGEGSIYADLVSTSDYSAAIECWAADITWYGDITVPTAYLCAGFDTNSSFTLIGTLIAEHDMVLTVTTDLDSRGWFEMESVTTTPAWPYLPVIISPSEEVGSITNQGISVQFVASYPDAVFSCPELPDGLDLTSAGLLTGALPHHGRHVFDVIMTSGALVGATAIMLTSRDTQAWRLRSVG